MRTTALDCMNNRGNAQNYRRDRYRREDKRTLFTELGTLICEYPFDP